jgi:hypothetical protein
MKSYKSLVCGIEALTSSSLHRVPPEYRFMFPFLLTMLNPDGVLEEAEPEKLGGLFYYDYPQFTPAVLQKALDCYAKAGIFKFGTLPDGGRVAKYVQETGPSGQTIVRYPAPESLRKRYGLGISLEGIVWDS